MANSNSSTLMPEAVRDAITEGYLETGKPLDVAQIARRLARSQSAVRRVIDEAHGAVEGTTARQESRPNQSRSYAGIVVGAHKVWTYVPTLWALRAMVLDLRGTDPYLTDLHADGMP